MSHETIGCMPFRRACRTSSTVLLRETDHQKNNERETFTRVKKYERLYNSEILVTRLSPPPNQSNIRTNIITSPFT